MKKLSFPLNNLIQTGVHLGHHSNERNTSAKPYIYGTRKKIDIINLQETLTNFYPITHLITQTIKNRGKILFYSTNIHATSTLKKAHLIHKQPTITGPWIPGTLSNFKSVINSKYYQNPKSCFGISNLNTLPNIIILLDKLPHPYLITEANKLHIPIIALTDSNTNSHSFPYILPANDDSLPSLNLFMQLFTQAILRGYAYEILSFSLPRMDSNQ